MVTYRRVPGFPDYEVGDDGSVWSRKTYEWSTRVGGRLKPWYVHGYPYVRLSDHGRLKTFKVHLLVLTLFRGPRPPDCPHSRHLDGNKQNAKLSNLVWGTAAQNEKDRVRHGTVLKGEKHPRVKLRACDVKAIRAARGKQTQYELAAKFGVAQQTISDIQSKRLWASVT